MANKLDREPALPHQAKMPEVLALVAVPLCASISSILSRAAALAAHMVARRQPLWAFGLVLAGAVGADRMGCRGDVFHRLSVAARWGLTLLPASLFFLGPPPPPPWATEHTRGVATLLPWMGTYRCPELAMGVRDRPACKRRYAASGGGGRCRSRQSPMPCTCPFCRDKIPPCATPLSSR